MNLLEGWENFYIIVGSSAGALIGLMFVVITLMADMPLTGIDEQASKVFTTPSVIHYSVVLFLSALISIPWSGVDIIAIFWGVAGVFGLLYIILVARRMRTQTMYDPVFEDWLFHVLLPLAAYLLMAVAAGVAHVHERVALFSVGAASLILLFTGIHNAWDLVTHMVFVRRKQQQEEESGSREKGNEKL
jgi:hypothetical protein